MNRKQLMALSKTKLVNLIINSGTVRSCSTCVYIDSPAYEDPCRICYLYSDCPKYTMNTKLLERQDG